MNRLDKLINELRAQNVLDKPMAQCLLAIANHPVASEIMVTPLTLRAILMIELDERGEALFNTLGIRQEYRLADLCYLAQYDDWLRYAVSVLLQHILDKSASR